MERLTLGRMQNPIRGFLHGFGAVGAFAATIYLVSKTWGNAAALIGSAVFGLALVVMFTVSSLYHSIPWGNEWKRRLQRIDHSMIYLVVAGTITPIAIASLDGVSRAICLSIAWGIAVVGIVLKLTLPEEKTALSITLQMLMGWLIVIWIPQIWDTIGGIGIALVAIGGILYSVGVVIFVTKRPRLFPRSFGYHELFHVFVILASFAHFLAVAHYAVPALVS